jgi:hypothetical protein
MSDQKKDCTLCCRAIDASDDVYVCTKCASAVHVKCHAYRMYDNAFYEDKKRSADAGLLAAGKVCLSDECDVCDADFDTHGDSVHTETDFTAWADGRRMQRWSTGYVFPEASLVLMVSAFMLTTFFQPWWFIALCLWLFLVFGGDSQAARSMVASLVGTALSFVAQGTHHVVFVGHEYMSHLFWIGTVLLTIKVVRDCRVYADPSRWEGRLSVLSVVCTLVRAYMSIWGNMYPDARTGFWFGYHGILSHILIWLAVIEFVSNFFPTSLVVTREGAPDARRSYPYVETTFPEPAKGKHLSDARRKPPKAAAVAPVL